MTSNLPNPQTPLLPILQPSTQLDDHLPLPPIDLISKPAPVILPSTFMVPLRVKMKRNGIECQDSAVNGVESLVSENLNVAGNVHKAATIEMARVFLESSNAPIIPLNPPPCDNRLRDPTKLNRSDWGELKRYRYLLGGRNLRLLESVEKKPEFYHKRYDDPNYLPQSSLLLLSPGWASAERYALCGISNTSNRSGACRLHKFCPSCCWYERAHAQLRYVPAFDKGTWHWITGSFTGDLHMRTECPINDVNDWRAYWDAYKTAFVQMVNTKTFRGVFWTEELAVNSFLPTRVLPHVHAVVEADDIDAQKLAQAVCDHLEKALGDNHLQPDIQHAPILSERSLKDRIGYMLKPINVLKAYRNAWEEALLDDRQLAPSLNSQATDLILGYSNVTTRRPKMIAKGSLDSKSKNFIGIPTRELNDYRQYLADLDDLTRDDYMEVCAEDDLNAAA